MKRVLIVSPSNKGTIGRCSMNLYKAFQMRKDVVVRFVCLHFYKEGFEELKDCDYCENNIQRNIFQKLILEIKKPIWLHKIKKQFKPDVTISTLISCSNASVLAGGKDMKVGIFHAGIEQYGLYTGRLSLLLYRILFPRLDRLECVCKSIQTSMISNYKNISPSKIGITYNVHFKEELVKKSKEPLDVNDSELFESKIILFVGRLEAIKAPERIIKSFALSKLKDEYQLVFVGADNNGYQHKLEKIAEEVKLVERVHFLGLKSNPYKYMSHSDMLVLSSKNEGLPGVLIESLLIGTPIISTNSSIGIWEILGCENEFNKELNTVFIANNGLITSNLEDEDLNIQNLKTAIEYLHYHDLRNSAFDFEAKVNPLEITKNLLNEQNQKIITFKCLR